MLIRFERERRLRSTRCLCPCARDLPNARVRPRLRREPAHFVAERRDVLLCRDGQTHVVESYAFTDMRVHNGATHERMSAL